MERATRGDKEANHKGFKNSYDAYKKGDNKQNMLTEAAVMEDDNIGNDAEA